MKPKQVFPGVFEVNGRLATKSIAPGTRVYGEELHKVGGGEYRLWDAYRSKLGAAIKKRLKKLDVAPGASVLYLGAATGTTVSHVSDIVGSKGIVFCVEFSPHCMRELLKVCEKRENLIPLLEDARFPQKYRDAVEEYAGGSVDVVFEDVADPEQVRILKENCKAFLKKNGQALIAIKSRSISGTGNPQEVFKKAREELEETFEVEQTLSLEPFEKDHELLSLRLKRQLRS